MWNGTEILHDCATTAGENICRKKKHKPKIKIISSNSNSHPQLWENDH